MHDSDTNIPKIICGFHSKELGHTQILQNWKSQGLISKILKVVSPLGESLIFQLSEDN